jgi:hypothetical protein
MVEISAPRGHPLPISEGLEVCMGQNFKLLLEGWCLEQSCWTGQGDNKYAKILSEGPATTELRGGESLYGAKFQVASRGLVSSAKL